MHRIRVTVEPPKGAVFGPYLFSDQIGATVPFTDPPMTAILAGVTVAEDGSSMDLVFETEQELPISIRGLGRISITTEESTP